MITESPLQQALFRPDKMGKSDLVRGQHLFCGLNAFEPGQQHAGHVHAGQDKLYVVLQGTARLTVGPETRTVEAGTVAFAAAGIEHGIENPGPERLLVLAVLSPPPA